MIYALRALAVGMVAAAALWVGTHRRDGSSPQVVAGRDTLQVLSVRTFAERVESGWADRGDALFLIEIDSSAPVSPPMVGVARFPAGFASGRGPINTSLDIGRHRYTKLHLTLWIKFSPQWHGNDAGVNKVLYIWHHGKPVVAITAVGRGRAPLTLQVRLQDIPGGARNLIPDPRRGAVRRGQWHRWEFLLTTNTPGRSDGRVLWWVDGRQAGYHTDVMFGDASGPHHWELVAWNPTYGGTGAPVPEDQSISIDHLIVAAR